MLRACAMTLIIATDEPDGGFSASQTISELMREHPSRGIVLAISEQAATPLKPACLRSAGNHSEKRSRFAASRLRSRLILKPIRISAQC